MHHGSWLWNSLFCASINNWILLLLWNPSFIINSRNISIFETPDFPFIYRLSTNCEKKTQSRPLFLYFVGMKSDERLCRSFELECKSVLVSCSLDFKSDRSKWLPSFASFLNGISRQQNLDDSFADDRKSEDPPIHSYAQFHEHGAFLCKKFNFGRSHPYHFWRLSWTTSFARPLRENINHWSFPVHEHF